MERQVHASGGYLPHVDGLRAVAIVAVVVYHAAPEILPGGFVGVDVFFVISGFLITRLILGEMAEGRYTFSGFLARRVRRLVPAAVVCFAGVTGIAALVMLPDAFRDYGRSLVAASLMFANVHFYFRTGYFEAPAHEQPLLHTWSLAVEDQFYLTWPLLLAVFAPRLPRPWLLAGIGLLLAASLAHAEAVLWNRPEFAFYMLLPRAWELLAGAGLAVAMGDRATFPISRAPAEVLAATGLAAIAGSFLMITGTSRFPGLAVLPAVIGTIAVIVAGNCRTAAGIRFLEAKPVVFVGLISYSLYLWHWPLLALTTYSVERRLANQEVILIIGLSVILAIFSWRYVEQPFRKRQGGPPVGARWVIGGGISILVTMAVAGTVIRLTHGLPDRFSPEVAKLFHDMRHGNPRRPKCDGHEQVFANDAVCAFGRPKAPGESFEIAVLGDSNADHFVPWIARWAERQGLVGRQVTHTMCGPLLGIERAGRTAREIASCEAYQQRLLEFVSRNPSLKAVVLAGNWESYGYKLAANRVDRLGHHTIPRISDFKSALMPTIEFFRRRGIRVILLGRIPFYDVLPARCVAKQIGAGIHPLDCGLSRQQALRGMDTVQRQLSEIAAAGKGVTLLDPAGVLCDASYCRPVKHGVFMYRDKGHLSLAGALHLDKYLTLPDVVERRQ